MKRLQNSQTWLTSVDISQRLTNIDKLFAYKSLQIGVIHDLQCPQTVNLFNVSSYNHWFSSSYNWLMFDESVENAKLILKPQNINWNAEITLALKQNKTTFKLYDVYNPSFHSGGGLNLTYKDEWIEKNRDLKALLTPNKIVHRSNFYGIQVYGSVVVRNRLFIVITQT
jgi:hypothetical protein